MCVGRYLAGFAIFNSTVFCKKLSPYKVSGLWYTGTAVSQQNELILLCWQNNHIRVTVNLINVTSRHSLPCVSTCLLGSAIMLASTDVNSGLFWVATHLHSQRDPADCYCPIWLWFCSMAVDPPQPSWPKAGTIKLKSEQVTWNSIVNKFYYNWNYFYMFIRSDHKFSQDSCQHWPHWWSLYHPLVWCAIYWTYRCDVLLYCTWNWNYIPTNPKKSPLWYANSLAVLKQVWKMQVYIRREMLFAWTVLRKIFYIPLTLFHSDSLG
jgi:hypothetical protein